MGGKSALLRGELGNILLREAKASERFVDLFAGSGSVGHYVAENLEIPVLSVDLQRYAQVLAASVIERTAPLAGSWVESEWVSGVSASLDNDPTFVALKRPVSEITQADVIEWRDACAVVSEEFFVTRHYGGHYFSPQQAYSMDALIRALPQFGPARIVGLSAIIQAASICAAAPGHTAQPFQPTTALMPHIRTAWARNVLDECQTTVTSLGQRHAKTLGVAIAGEALSIAGDLRRGDLVFCDPPYSAVQYSRFYHVLEGLAIGGWPSVFGAGRSPALKLRKASDFSLKSKANEAMSQLLRTLREQDCRVIITFPDAKASNGLSSSDIVALASRQWNLTTTYVDSTHSTLGGTSMEGGRGARRSLQEAVLLLDPN